MFSLKYLILVFYFFILFLIGLFAARRIKSLKDFYVGGKKMGFWVVAFSARATGESAWLLLGLTGLGAISGISALWVVVGEVIGEAISWIFMAKRFKRETDEYGSITIPDYLVSRFKAKTHTLRVLSASALAIFVTIYVSAQIDATGTAFESFLGWNYYTGILIGFGIVVVYIYSGGFVAVAWSDLFQGLIMLVGLVVLPAAAYYTITNMDALTIGLKAIDPALLNIWGKGGFNLYNLFTILSFAMIGIGFLGSPQLYVRFMSIRNENEIKNGTVVALVFTILTDTAAVLIGILGRYLLTGTGQDPVSILGNGGQNVLPMLVEHIFPAVIVGIYIAAVLAAIMSTVDSLLIVASSAITRDFYEQIFHPEVKEETLAGKSRMVTLILAAIALIIALTVSFVSPTRTVFWFAIFGWSGISATFCPVIILSLFWKGYNQRGAIASMVTGFLSVPFFKFVAVTIPYVGPYFKTLKELPPSFFLALIAGVIAARMYKEKSQPADRVIR